MGYYKIDDKILNKTVLELLTHNRLFIENIDNHIPNIY